VNQELEENVRVQYGALPYCWRDTGELRVLLITSRRSRRWIVPKGWPMKGRKPWETAEIEARDEAGVIGVVSKRPVGRFLYDKLLDEDGRVVVCEVTVYPLHVEWRLKNWREAQQREGAWFSRSKAVALASDHGLRDLIQGFAPPAPRR